ncbi:tetraacyldisaccharide 4'-kinase [Aequorivita marina]|uniref:tetraacyldisaccharide 4'-kinase n=1 Tax=Aequorivita marina TaxID=3073654 RepID=UPI0028740E9C|nr:tetraacyldisaccharide 4'-kinase [Aequorivita sp. S2608]MDS1298300.1 tetraacyldisaccharide 4'-kinase [Aequorivita sp. S2608]
MNLLRKLLFPFSLLYGGITALRNLLYDKGVLKSKTYDIPIICVGNLSTGGTGKSPMIELLVSYLKTDHEIAVLSRGYKRKTSGFKTVLVDSTVEEVGDEPLQFKRKFPEISVAVCEDRQTGIEKLKTSAAVILLDDAFQHRKVKASLNILLTPYNNLYSKDCMLPAGNLREPRFGARRAQIVVVTKCPENIDAPKMELIKRKLSLKPHQAVYFSKIGYSSQIKNNTGSKPLTYLKNKKFLLVTGIANPKPFVEYLRQEGLQFETKSFPDHHNFSSVEIKQLEKHELILTTEKDFMRLRPLADKTEIYFLPITTILLNEAELDFKAKVIKKVGLVD